MVVCCSRLHLALVVVVVVGRSWQATNVPQPAGLLYRPLFERSKLPPTRCPRAPTDAFRTPAAEAGTFQTPLLGAPTPTDAFRTLAAEAGTTMSGNRPVNSAKNVDFHVHFGIFYMPQIYDMGPTALLPFRRKACLRVFPLLKIRRLRPGLNPRTWVPEASTPLPGSCFPSSSSITYPSKHVWS
jgi:hypothetical protein